MTISMDCDNSTAVQGITERMYSAGLGGESQPDTLIGDYKIIGMDMS